MSVADIERDLDLGQTFWEKKQNGYSFKLRLKRILLPVLRAEDEDDIGIRLAQMRFRRVSKHTGEIKPEWKTRWFTDKKKVRKRDVNVSVCNWRLIPLAIVSGKQSTERADLMVIYFMHIHQIADPTQAELEKDTFAKGAAADYYAQIETDLSGAIIRKHYYPGKPHGELPCRFAFPKRYVKAMNRCLVNNYWQDLWRGQDCYAWVRTEEGRPWYLAEQTHRVDPSYHDQLLNLLNSPVGDTAAILCAYTCFAIMKDFFPQYHSLRKDTPYLIAQKNLPKQFALVVQGEDAEATKRLVGYFCQPFQEAAWPKATTAGVQVLVNRKEPKQPTLGANEFVANVLQPASPLWVNRTPAHELIQSGQIFHIRISGPIPTIDHPFAKDLLCDLTGHLHNIVESRLEECWKECWRLSKPIILDTLSAVKKYAVECGYSISHIELGRVSEFLLQREELAVMPNEILDMVSNLENRYKEDIWEYTSEATAISEGVDMFDTALKSEFSTCRRKLKKVKQETEIRYFSMEEEYGKALEMIMPDAMAYHANLQVIHNVSFLVAAIFVYIRGCVEPKNQSAILNRFLSALKKLYQLDAQPIDSARLLEDYLYAKIKSGQCARVRGQGSTRADVKIWYDPMTATFLLPAHTFYNDLSEVLWNGCTPPYREEEIKANMREQALLRTVKGRHLTVRRSLATGDDRPPVFEILDKHFLERFRGHTAVIKAMESMMSDKTPYRKRATALSDGH